MRPASITSSRISKLVEFIKEYLILRFSGAIDEQYYYLSYPEILEAYADPTFHYLASGWKEGRNPSAFFETQYYVAHNPDVLFSIINPLVHYITCGVLEERPPSRSVHTNARITPARSPIAPQLNRLLCWFVRRVYRPFSKTIRKQPAIPTNPFTLPGQEVLSRYEAELTNWTQVKAMLVIKNDKLWVVKPCISRDDLRRELLVHSLSKGLVNAAEIIPASFNDIYHLFGMGLVDNTASPDNTLLVRLAQEYARKELPLQDVDYATAGELVFSLWVRRRDVGNYNRAYTHDGVPVFFDYHASLNSEPGLQDSKAFFDRDGPHGHAGNWRVVEDKSVPLYTIASRHTSILHITDVATFKRAINYFVLKIQSTDFNLKEAMERSGFSRSDVRFLAGFLETTRKELPKDVTAMLRVILPPDRYGS